MKFPVSLAQLLHAAAALAQGPLARLELGAGKRRRRWFQRLSQRIYLQQAHRPVLARWFCALAWVFHEN